MSPAREDRGPRRIGESLDHVTRHLGAPPASAVGRIFSSWEAIAGEVIAAHTAPVSLVRGGLVVEAESAIWATELRYFTTALLAKIDDAVGPRVVERIEVRVARSDGSPNSRKKASDQG